MGDVLCHGGLTRSCNGKTEDQVIVSRRVMEQIREIEKLRNLGPFNTYTHTHETRQQVKALRVVQSRGIRRLNDKEWTDGSLAMSKAMHMLSQSEGRKPTNVPARINDDSLSA